MLLVHREKPFARPVYICSLYYQRITSVYNSTSMCSTKEKTLGRKCFLQLLGVLFPTLRPTKRQMAAKTRDLSVMRFHWWTASLFHSSQNILVILASLTKLFHLITDDDL